MTRSRFAISVLVVIAISSDPATAKGTASITFLDDTAGVAADAHVYRRPATSSQGFQTAVGKRGPVRIPLAPQVECGHEPGFPGGQTCMLPPPPDIQVAERRRNRPDPEGVARRLADRAISLAPKPDLRLAPSRRGLTGLESYFWLRRRPQPITARATAGPFTVTAQARPVQYVWTFGDGNDRATRHSGRRWTRKRPGNIGHTYETKRRYTVLVEVIWHARWRIGLGPWRSLGYFSNSDSARYRVRELVPVLVRHDP